MTFIEDDLPDVWPERAIAFLTSLAMGRTLADGVPFVLRRLEDETAKALLAREPDHPARERVVARVQAACLSLLDRLNADRTSEDTFNGWRYKHAREPENLWLRMRPVGIGRPPYNDTEPTPGEVDGRPMLAWDATFAAWARERFPRHGEAIAAFTERAAERWETWATGKGEQLDLAPGGRLFNLWRPWVANAMPDRVEPVEGTVEGTAVDLNDPSFWASYKPPQRFTILAAWITWTVWDELRAEIGTSLAREAATVAPGIPLPFAVTLASLAGPVWLSKDREVLSGQHSTGLAVAPGVDLATWTVVARHLPTLSARRAASWLAHVAWLAHSAGDRGASGVGWSARVQHDRSVAVRIEGGLTGLAAVLEINGKDAGGEVFAALEALAGVVLSVQTRPEEGLTGAIVAQVRRSRGSPGRPGFVSCTLSPWWSPGAVFGMVENADKAIVPVLWPPPPTEVLGTRIRNLGAALEEHALVELATHAREVVTLGGVVIGWRALAPELKAADVDALVDDWRKRERWVQVGTDRWMLGTSDPGLVAAGELIRQGGLLRESRARGGRNSAEKKRGGRR